MSLAGSRLTGPSSTPTTITGTFSNNGLLYFEEDIRVVMVPNNMKQTKASASENELETEQANFGMSVRVSVPLRHYEPSQKIARDHEQRHRDKKRSFRHRRGRETNDTGSFR
jgi:hypothetical protein